MRPFHKKKRFIIPAVLVVLLIIVIGSAGDGGTQSATTPTAPAAGGTTSTACATAYPDKQDTDVCADDTGTVVLDEVAVTATPFAPTKGLAGKALCTNVTIKNDSGESRPYNVFDFKIQTPSGDVATTGAAGLDGTLNSGTLVAGGTKTGKVCSDSTDEKGQYVFIYKPNPFLADRGIWLFSV
jgi:hypothetical protein